MPTGGVEPRMLNRPCCWSRWRGPLGLWSWIDHQWSLNGPRAPVLIIDTPPPGALTLVAVDLDGMHRVADGDLGCPWCLNEDYLVGVLEPFSCCWVDSAAWKIAGIGEMGTAGQRSGSALCSIVRYGMLNTAP